MPRRAALRLGQRRGGGEHVPVGYLGPAGTVVIRLRGDRDGALRRAVPERVAARGGGDRRPVGEQEVEPPRPARRLDGRDRAGQRGGHRAARPQPLEHQRPQERRVDHRLKRRQDSGGGWLRQRAGYRRLVVTTTRLGTPLGDRRRDSGPALEAPVVAEQPASVTERRGRLLAHRGARGRRADRGEHRSGPGDPGDVGQGRVRPHRHAPPVPGRVRVTVGVPADTEPVGVHRAVQLQPRRPRLPVQGVRRVDQQRPQRRRRPEVSEVPAH